MASIVTTQFKEDTLTSTYRGNAVSDSSVTSIRTIRSLGETTWDLYEESIDTVMKYYVATEVKGLDSHTALNLSCMFVSN